MADWVNWCGSAWGPVLLVVGAAGLGAVAVLGLAAWVGWRSERGRETTDGRRQ